MFTGSCKYDNSGPNKRVPDHLKKPNNDPMKTRIKQTFNAQQYKKAQVKANSQ